MQTVSYEPARFLSSCPLRVSRMLIVNRKGILHMNTILAINAISTLLAAVGIGGFLVLRDRRARRESDVEPVYVTMRRYPGQR
jgi:hypothetical protein